eukprot:gene21196-28101_t
MVPSPYAKDLGLLTCTCVVALVSVPMDKDTEMAGMAGRIDNVRMIEYLADAMVESFQDA